MRLNQIGFRFFFEGDAALDPTQCQPDDQRPEQAIDDDAGGKAHRRVVWEPELLDGLVGKHEQEGEERHEPAQPADPFAQEDGQTRHARRAHAFD